jgi:sulfatase modifying factor 1
MTVRVRAVRSTPSRPTNLDLDLDPDPDPYPDPDGRSLDIPCHRRCPREVPLRLPSRTSWWPLAAQTALAIAAGCDGSASTGAQGHDGGSDDATFSATDTGSGGSSGSGSGAGSGSSGGGLGASSGSEAGGDASVDDADSGLSAPVVDSGSSMQSCAPGGPGLTTCGSGSESCCTSLEVTGGSYQRTYDPYDSADGGVAMAADGGPAGEADPASVSTFRLDKYEVTVGRFRRFVSAVLPLDGGPGWTPPAASGKHTHLNSGRGLSATGGGYEPGWVATDDNEVAPTDANLACQPMDDTWTTTAENQETLPVNCVNWYEAYAFCIWDGGFLPSEAEWEYAAAGGGQQREYPWGSADPGTSNGYAIYDGYYPDGAVPDAAPGTPGSPMGVSVANIAPVGTPALGATLFGQLDLAGNVSEWDLDWQASSYPNPCTDCASLATASFRVVRGGSFVAALPFLLASFRSADPPSTRSFYYGFRCARTP